MGVEEGPAEDTMNAYVSDRIAREHADRLMADAAAARRARRARQARRGTSITTNRVAADRSRTAARPGAAAAARFVKHPFAALHSWLVAGEM
jgi:hypothetical protein